MREGAAARDRLGGAQFVAEPHEAFLFGDKFFEKLGEPLHDRLARQLRDGFPVPPVKKAF